jgi:hypothetical protein
MRTALGTGLAIALTMCGCATVRRDSLKAIDPAVQKEPRLERARARGGFRLGPYTIVQRRLRELAVDQTPATIEGPRRPAWKWQLDVELTMERGAPWEGRCTGTRQSNIDSDFGVIAGIANDTVTIDCELVGGSTRWRFLAAGRLDENIFGDLERTDRSEQTSKVEIIMWFKRVKLISRHLGEPVAQVRRGKKVVAAMVLSRPEWAWVQRSEDEDVRAAAMLTLAAVRLLPLGWDD